ncbi:DNA recombination protein RmuC [Patescibacteria group bacterium]|nr:DNA recombination protein RmuC [Patescibacteria group bacterium]
MDALVVLLGIIVAILAYFLLRRGGGKGGDQSLLLLQGQLNEIRQTLDAKLSESTKAIQSQFGESAKIVKEITQELAKVNEGNSQVIGITEQLRDLQDVLKNTKQRGMLGEYSLELILKNFFPNNYERQYKFNNGDIVDFVIKIKDKLISIDSKFSLENYQRILEAKTDADRERYETLFKADLKNRIDETSKYVKPGEGTMDFAFMFIPAEAIYYDLLINRIGAIKSNTRDMIEYAGEKHVIVVSPTTFLAYLQTVLQGLRALQIEESSKEISKWVEDLGRHLKSYEEYMGKLDNSLNITRTIYDRAKWEFSKIDKDILRISGSQPIDKIEGPEMRK